MYLQAIRALSTGLSRLGFACSFVFLLEILAGCGGQSPSTSSPPVNGGWPTHISKIKQPSEYTSERASTSVFAICSGDM